MQAESVEVLEKADVPPAQARAIVRAIEIEMGGAKDTLATAGNACGAAEKSCWLTSDGNAGPVLRTESAPYSAAAVENVRQACEPLHGHAPLGSRIWTDADRP